MNRTIKLLFPLVALGLITASGCPPTGGSQERNFTAPTFLGTAEVPPVTTNGSGAGTFALNAAQTEVAYYISAENLGSNVTAAHFHIAPTGQDGPIVEDITNNIQGNATSLNINGRWTNLTASEVASLLAGNVYVNIHTTQNPDGELRGQLVEDTGGN